jgi:branched-chain amino acid transport system permease protein
MKSFLKHMKSVQFFWLGGAFILCAFLPLFIGRGYVSLINEMLILAIAALGLNILLGYTGLVNFGPAGLYAVGAYTTALILINTSIPFGLALVAGPVMTAIVSLFVGWFCVRLTSVYFALLTLAFSEIIHVIIFNWYSFTRGDDGIVNIPIPEFWDYYSYYYLCLIIVSICLALLWIIVNSPFGKTLQAIRENPHRAESIGINVRRYRLKAFVVSGTFLGVAGSLFSAFNQNVFPDYAGTMKSMEMIVVILIGGIYSFLGPFVGSIVFILLDKFVTKYFEYWPLVLGMVVIALLLFLRGGIVGFFEERIALVKGKKENVRN